MFFVPLYPLFGLNNACTVCSRLYELVIGRDILATKVRLPVVYTYQRRMTTIGQLDELQPNSEKISTYLE